MENLISSNSGSSNIESTQQLVSNVRLSNMGGYYHWQGSITTIFSQCFVFAFASQLASFVGSGNNILDSYKCTRLISY